MASGFLASVRVEKGDADRAIPLLEPALDELARAPFAYCSGLFTACLAQAHLLGLRTQRARALAARAVQLTTEAKTVQGIGEAERVARHIALVERDLPGAQRHLNDVLTAFAASQACLGVAPARGLTSPNWRWPAASRQT